MTAVLRALVARYSLAGERLGDVSLGAVIKHSRDFNLARESTLSSGLAPETPAFDIQRACGTSLSAAIIIGSKISTGLIDAGIAGGTDSISDVPLVYPEAYRTHAARERARPLARRAPHAVAQAAAGTLQARVSERDRAAHEALDGREHGDHGQGMAPHARGARPPRAREPSERCARVRRRVLRRPRRRVSGRQARQQPSSRHEPRAARQAQAGFRPRARRHADGRQQHAADRRRVRRAAVVGGLGEEPRTADCALI